jgi:hypothetical protein
VGRDEALSEAIAQHEGFFAPMQRFPEPEQRDRIA